MKNFTRIDLVAATMRNAIFEAANFNLMTADDRTYEQFDAQILETCYQKTDLLTADEINTYAECINMGFELSFDREREEFFIIH